MVSKAPPARLLIPAQRRPSRERLLATLPFFLRNLAVVPVEAPPRILAFETDAFMDDFLAAAGQPAPAFPALRPWRDWSEPPDGLVDAAGAIRYPAAIVRRRPDAAEIEASGGPAMDSDGVPHGASAATPAWLRKLYLPLHERFNLVAFDVVCGAAGWPPVARSRIKGSGAIVRRLVARTDSEHWEDWIALDEKHGAWIEVLDASLRPASGTGQADPAALSGLSSTATVRLHALFGLAADAPLPPLALNSQPLNLLPPNVGKAAEHCTLYGYLPVFSSAREVSAERLTADSIDAIAARMSQRTGDRLDALFLSGANLRGAATPYLRTLLDDTVLPARPTAAQTATAGALVAGLLSAPPFGLAHPENAVAQGIDLAVLSDRGGRELPVAPTWCPHSASLPAAQMLALERADDGRLSFRLMPHQLGRLDVDVSRSHNGLSLSIRTESDGATAILSAAQTRLADEIRAQGVKLADTQMFSGDARQSPGQDAYSRPAPLIETFLSSNETVDVPEPEQRDGRYA